MYFLIEVIEIIMSSSRVLIKLLKSWLKYSTKENHFSKLSR